jgi:uridine kinase
MGDLETVVSAVHTAQERYRRSVLVGLDGRSGTGKSTLALQLVAELGGVHVVGDDFWAAGPAREWEARAVAARVERALDWRRLRKDVLEPLLRGEAARYRPLIDVAGGRRLAARSLQLDPAPVILLDGIYCTRSELADLLDVTVLLQLDDAVRRRRRDAREDGASTPAWHDLWDDTESLYLSTRRRPEDFDVVLPAERPY